MTDFYFIYFKIKYSCDNKAEYSVVIYSTQEKWF